MYVKDFRDKEILKSSAVLIRGKYYELGKDCIKYQGLHYRVTSKKVTKDWATGKLVHVNEIRNMAYGLVAADMTMGYFTPSPANVQVYFLVKTSSTNKLAAMVDAPGIGARRPSRLDELPGFVVKRGGVDYTWTGQVAISYEIAVENGFLESCSTNGFYKSSDCDSDIRRLLTLKSTPKSERVSDLYNIGDDQASFQQLMDNYDKLVVRSSIKDRAISNLIEPFTYGLEFEVTNGFLPKYFRDSHGIKGLRDGSVANSGLEYVTVPMKDAKGITTLRKITNRLTARCENDDSCSLHVHYGNTGRDRTYAVALWLLCTKLQKEIFEHMPASRMHPRNGHDSYCKMLPNIGIKTDVLSKPKDKEAFDAAVTDGFARLYMFLNDHPPGHIYESKTEKVKAVVEGEEVYKHIVKNKRYSVKDIRHSIQGQKWNRKSRYYWVNFLNLYFSEYRTVEFRCHEATLNTSKTLAWMIITASILKFANNYKDCFSAEPATLKQVLEGTIKDKKIVKYLLEYLEVRNKAFSGKSYEDKLKKESVWLSNDLDFTFKSSEGLEL